jgi:hypothetical protein
MAAIAAMKFRFHEEEDASDTVSRIAGLMHTRQPQHLLSGDFLHETWDPALVGRWACLLGPLGLPGPAGLLAGPAGPAWAAGVSNECSLA